MATIDIVTGFLGSGKTLLASSMVEHYLSQGEKVLLLQYEKGRESPGRDVAENPLFANEILEGSRPPDLEHLFSLVELFKPQRVIIEYNGMLQLELLLEVLETRKIRKALKVKNISGVVNTSTLDIYAANFGDLLMEPLTQCDYIFLTHTDMIDRKKIADTYKKIKGFNKSAEIIEIPAPGDWKENIPEPEFYQDAGVKLIASWDHMISLNLIYGVILLSFLAYQAQMRSVMDIYFPRFLTFNTMCLSILVQAFPFILLGVLVSAFIQVFVPETFFTRLFSRNIFLSMGMALIAGVFFPVCDCAIIPVMRRLVQKGVPLASAVTFLLAAPVVDPVVIASTLYAFPLNPRVALWRLGLGIIIALIGGAFFLLLPYKKKVLQEGLSFSGCRCGYCGQQGNQVKSLNKKLAGVIRHGTVEFFDVGRFIIIGAAFSTYLQIYVPRETISIFSESTMGSLFTMMAFAFVLSVCSTSDAFIAMSFTPSFPMGSVMAFMVFGAVLDIKNLLLLNGSFQRAFVIKLVIIIILITFSVLFLFNTIFQGVIP